MMNDTSKIIAEKYSSKWDSHLKFHLSEEQLDVPFEQYTKNKRIELSKVVLAKKRIYMDLKYWIYLRDAYRGNPQKSIHYEIASNLYQLAELGYIICPANHTILTETLKQTDPKSRATTCKIIDELSQNVIIEPYPLLVDIELTNLLSSFLYGKEKIYKMVQLVWGKAGNILGQHIPSNKGFDSITENAIQKTILDMTTDLTFSEIADIWTSTGIKQEYLDSPEHAKNRTIETNKHRGDFNTFQDVYEIELHGLLDEMKEEMSSILEYLYKKKIGGVIPEEERGNVESSKPFINLIVQAYKLGKLKIEFPQLHIQASIHATLRYKNMPFKKGDFYDYFHASSALPYCNLFFTERKLANFLTQSPLNLDKTYGCKILHREEEVLEELIQIHL